MLNHDGRKAHRDSFQTIYTLRAERSVIGTIAAGDLFTVTIWGGTINGETHAMAGITLPEVNQRYVLMLSPEWRTSVTPIVGLDQGLFKIIGTESSGTERLVDFQGHILQQRIDSGAQRLSVSQFTDWIQLMSGLSPDRLAERQLLGVWPLVDPNIDVANGDFKTKRKQLIRNGA